MVFRLIFFLLLFVNLVLFAWAQGYFGATDSNREPERLGQQLQPEKLRIVSSNPAVKAPVPVRNTDLACSIVSGLRMVEAEAIKAAALEAGAEVQLVPVVDPASHVVIIPDLPSAALAEKKAAELRRLGVSEIEAVTLEGGRQEIVLGRFPEESGAREFLAGLNKRGVKSARVETREQPPAKARVELRSAATALPQLLSKLMANYPDATATECLR